MKDDIVNAFGQIALDTELVRLSMLRMQVSPELQRRLQLEYKKPFPEMLLVLPLMMYFGWGGAPSVFLLTFLAHPRSTR